MGKNKEYKGLDLPHLGKEILSYWNKNSVFEKSTKESNQSNNFTFYEGPPSANGMPGTRMGFLLSLELKNNLI